MSNSQHRPSSVKLAVAVATDPGRNPHKQVNEDAFAEKVFPIGHLLIVCDGAGGHAGGKEASELAVRTMLEHMAPVPADGHPVESLKKAIRHTAEAVDDLGGPFDPAPPGSTMVLVLCHPSGSEVAHIGDSRAYLIRNSQIEQLTRDHSRAQEMIDDGILKPEHAREHRDGNRLTRALGMDWRIEADFRPTPIAHRVGDVFLLVTDGLTDLVSSEEILAVVLNAQQTLGLDAACRQLVALANERGGKDNITVMLAQIVECPPCQES